VQFEIALDYDAVIELAHMDKGIKSEIDRGLRGLRA
jgi:hypothetical protein